MSSKTRSGPLEMAKSVGRGAFELAGLMRRMIVTYTADAIWQVTGHTLLDGETETRDADVFAGSVGFYSRPAANGGDVEAVVTFPAGGQATPIVISVRQEQVRRDVAGDLEADTTQVFNTLARLRINPDGTIDAVSHGGTGRRLAFADEVNDLASAIAGHTHAYLNVESPAVTATPTPASFPGSAGTDVLMAE